MDYAKRIGQVGALAVVLGWGGGDYPRDRLCRADGSEPRAPIRRSTRARRWVGPPVRWLRYRAPVCHRSACDR